MYSRMKRKIYVATGLLLLATVAIYSRESLTVNQYSSTRIQAGSFLKTREQALVGDSNRNGWRILNIQTRAEVYSAFYDDRQEPVVRILGLQNSADLPIDYYCMVRYPSGRETCLSKPAQQIIANRGDEKAYKHFWAHMYICEVGQGEVPSHIGLSVFKDCTSAVVLPVTDKTIEKVKHEFGVCFQTAIHVGHLDHRNSKTEIKVLDIGTIIEGIERNRAMGAQWMTVYVLEATKEVMRVLKDYEKQGVLEIVDWNLSENLHNNSYYKAESVSIADCLYRNMYRVKYLILVDLDEVIVPQKHTNWKDMMSDLYNESIAVYQFQHSSMVTERGLRGKNQQIPFTCRKAGKTVELKTPLYLQRTHRTPPYPFQEVQKTRGLRQKMMVVPTEILTLGIHTIRAYPLVHKESYMRSIPSEAGLLYHYREPELCGYCKPLLQDSRLRTIAPQLSDNIKDRLCIYQ